MLSSTHRSGGGRSGVGGDAGFARVFEGFLPRLRGGSKKSAGTRDEEVGEYSRGHVVRRRRLCERFKSEVFPEKLKLKTLVFFIKRERESANGEEGKRERQTDRQTELERCGGFLSSFVGRGCCCWLFVLRFFRAAQKEIFNSKKKKKKKKKNKNKRERMKKPRRQLGEQRWPWRNGGGGAKNTDAGARGGEERKLATKAEANKNTDEKKDDDDDDEKRTTFQKPPPLDIPRERDEEFQRELQETSKVLREKFLTTTTTLPTSAKKKNNEEQRSENITTTTTTTAADATTPSVHLHHRLRGHVYSEVPTFEAERTNAGGKRRRARRRSVLVKLEALDEKTKEWRKLEAYVSVDDDDEEDDDDDEERE